ncbi:MAG TPA: M20/M25/M40 family metallo-hydrolase [Spirochaetota bacterium]|nr:M20/M25/M40 family metallo-hydrolase [Spirochaetota bacterium]HPI88098.1 M20/M25/M40 family metallo-hydrolase [Spirochaetota bacterium]HPR46417.1 M20/M25/M40 family metallo-hydrolase [Spirochaetota bacterium]
MYTINQERLITTFMDLTRIPSPSWDEGEVINFIINRAKSLGLKYKKIPCRQSFNLLITLEGDKKIKPILFSAHTDTVTPCENVNPQRSKTKITADGNSILGSDDKAAIAMFLEGLNYIRENDIPHGDVEVLLSCAEEIGLKGIKLFDMSQIKSKHAFVFDCTGSVGKIILKAPYHLNMSLKVKGKAAHAGIEPEKGINAINILAEIITKIPSGRIDDETTVNVGMITGGRATNIVAEEASCELEIRSISNSKMKQYERTIKEIARTIARDNKGRITILSNLEYAGFSINESAYITKTVRKSLEAIGIKAEYHISGGGSDTNIFNKSGIKAVNLSCGMQNVHSTTEYIAIADLINGTRLMLAIVNTVYQNR